MLDPLENYLQIALLVPTDREKRRETGQPAELRRLFSRRRRLRTSDLQLVESIPDATLRATVSRDSSVADLWVVLLS